MWAGGSVSWPGTNDGNYLRVEEQVQEKTKVLFCEPKIIAKTEEPVLVVRIEKIFSNDRGPAVVNKGAVSISGGFGPREASDDCTAASNKKC